MNVTGKKQNVKRLMGFFSISMMMLGMAVLFGNCSEPKHGSAKASSSTITFTNCSLTGTDHLFSLTYSPILQRQCVRCHIPGGIGKGSFASPGLALAYDAFSLVGYKRIGQFAVNPNHNPPYTGAVNATDIAKAEEAWELGVKELAVCKSTVVEEFVDDPWKDVRVNLRSKAINPSTAGEVQVRWNLGTETLALPAGVTWPAAPGAVFEITVRANAGGTTANYTIMRPRIIYPNNNAQAVDLRLQSLRVRLNGVEVINETTFHYVDAGARANSNTLLSSGAMVALTPLRTSDLISISFGKAEVVTLPPPPPSPSISFVQASTSTAENGRVTVIARLSQAVDAFVTASYSTNASGGSARVPCCSELIDAAGMAVDVKNFDRDFIPVLRDGGTLVFEPSITEKTIEVDIVNDQRQETNETIILRLESVTVGNGPGELGANPSHTITINDDDPAPGPFEITYTMLMAPGGAFNRYCVRCHHANSDDVVAREYDMTTHTDLLDRNRVVPDNANGSLLWGRILGNWNGAPVEPMPQGGLFDTDGLQAKDDIYQWIQSGAKNN